MAAPVPKPRASPSGPELPEDAVPTLAEVLAAGPGANGRPIRDVSVVTFAPANVDTIGATYTIDWTANLRHVLTLTANTALSFANPPGPCNGMIWLVQSSGGHLPTFPLGTESPPDQAIDPAAGARTCLGCAFDGSVWTIVSAGGPMVSPAVLVSL